MPYDRAEADRLWNLVLDWGNRKGPTSELVEHLLSNHYSVEAVTDTLGRLWQIDPFGSEIQRQVAAAVLQVRIANEQITASKRLSDAANRLTVAAILLSAVSALAAIAALFK